MAEELLGMTYLKNKLAIKKIRVDLRYRYYEMKKKSRTWASPRRPTCGRC